MDKKKVHLIAAARPNFMKIAPLYHALVKDPVFETSIIHTGQHYDANMSGSFFDDLGLPAPHINLEIGSGSHSEQTAGVMLEYEKICSASKPDIIVVVGDVNSTVAVTLVGAKLLIPIVHLEAGLRSRDRTMPEEINRLVTDCIAELLWTPSPDADENLKAEGVDEGKIEFVGNIMIDSLELMRQRIEQENEPARLDLEPGNYAVLTMHRPSNVDDKAILSAIVASLIQASQSVPFVFPLHPRTQKQLDQFGLRQSLNDAPGIHMMEPLSYILFMNLVFSSCLVLTDSGGLQEETTYLGIPCLTLRPNTERPITITQGTNRLITAETMVDEIKTALGKSRSESKKPDLWDGKTASRCVKSLHRHFYI